MRAKFKLGHVVMTVGVSTWICEAPGGASKVDARHNAVVDCLFRHQQCDWGEVSAADAQANNAAVIDGDRIMSVYTVDGRKLWIITDGYRSVTTTLFPEEY